MNNNQNLLLYKKTFSTNEFAALLAEHNKEIGDTSFFSDFIWSAVEDRILIPLPLPFIGGDRNRTFKRKDLLELAANNRFNLPDQLQLEEKSEDILHKYTTPLLELQKKAIANFWINYDPNSPPKQKTIIDWLINEGKEINISEREAKAIDSIIRPPQQKLGGNRPHKKAKSDTQKTHI